MEYDEHLFENFIDIPVAAVSGDMKTGIIGWVRVALLKDGKREIYYDSRETISTSTYYSGARSLDFASRYTGKERSFFISYDLHSLSVSGGSTGSSVAIAMVALVENKTIIPGCLITGEIDEEGKMKETGGIPLKVEVAGRAGMKKMIIPYGQSSMLAYVKNNNPGLGTKNSYIAKRIDLVGYSMRKYNLSLMEASDIREALPLMLG